VYWVLAENGVIKVQPDIVNILLEHLVAWVFFLRFFKTPKEYLHKLSEKTGLKRDFVKFKGTNE